MYIIMSDDGKCVVKGKTRKYLCAVDEPTQKQLVAYDSQRSAESAVMRMYLLKSPGAEEMYGGATPRLVITQADL